MGNQEARTRQTLRFFENNDTNLGFRRLLDCVADTQDMQLYKEAIELTNWKEKNPEQQAVLTEKAKALLLKTGNATLSEYNASKAVVVARDLIKWWWRYSVVLSLLSV